MHCRRAPSTAWCPACQTARTAASSSWACGTGKTFTALRITERMGGRVLFLAPSVTLVSQARREWLRHASRPMRALVVCSDGTAGRSESDDMSVSEMSCRVTTDPTKIADALAGGANAVFCTYQSLERVSEAQQQYGAPEFDLIVADEAHRTTGGERQGIPPAA